MRHLRNYGTWKVVIVVGILLCLWTHSMPVKIRRVHYLTGIDYNCYQTFNLFKPSDVYMRQ